MKIVLDKRPSTQNDPKTFFAIRLYPETNEEMGQMEWGLECVPQPKEIRRVFNGNGDMTFHYAIIFEKQDMETHYVCPVCGQNKLQSLYGDYCIYCEAKERLHK